MTSISRLQRSILFSDHIPGPLAQAFAFRAFGANYIVALQSFDNYGVRLAPVVGFGRGVVVLGGIGSPLGATRPLRVNAMRLSRLAPSLTTTLIERNEPSRALLVGLYARTYCVRISRTISFAI